MLTITVPDGEGFDESKQEFTTIGGTILELEHSLVSLSKWESIYEQPFLESKEKTTEQVIHYIKIMTLTPEVADDVYTRLTEQNFIDINTYLNAKMTATWFSDSVKPQSREIITAELIYYWMTVFNIPFECETWHLNRLFTLIRICNAKQEKPKKMSRAEIAARNRELNAQRKAKLGTKG